MDKMKCTSIINGYVCNASLNQLNKFRNQNNLDFKTIKELNRTRINLFKNQKLIAIAFKYTGSNNDNIQIIVKNNIGT